MLKRNPHPSAPVPRAGRPEVIERSVPLAAAGPTPRRAACAPSTVDEGHHDRTRPRRNGDGPRSDPPRPRSRSARLPTRARQLHANRLECARRRVEATGIRGQPAGAPRAPPRRLGAPRAPVRRRSIGAGHRAIRWRPNGIGGSPEAHPARAASNRPVPLRRESGPRIQDARRPRRPHLARGQSVAVASRDNPAKTRLLAGRFWRRTA